MALRAAGCRGGLVNAGGDLAVFGSRSHAIVIRGHGAGDSVVELKNGALATSDACGAARPTEHRGYYHGRARGEMNSGLLESFDARLVDYEFNQ